MEKFNLPQIASVVMHDELDLPSLGEKKVALFAVIPDNDSSLNYIIGMMYTQLFQELYYSADFIHHGSLPVHVHCVMDEFANVALPDEFDKLLATMRSREITFSILAIAVAVGIYFGFRNILGTETVSWLCILGAFPFGAMGFIRYNGMTAEQFAMAFVKSEFLIPKQLCFESEDLFWNLLGSTIESKSAATRQVKKKNKRKRGKGCD